MSDKVIKVAFADDHKIFRDGIKMALSDKENLKITFPHDLLIAEAILKKNNRLLS